MSHQRRRTLAPSRSSALTISTSAPVRAKTLSARTAGFNRCPSGLLHLCAALAEDVLLLDLATAFEERRTHVALLFRSQGRSTESLAPGDQQLSINL